MKITKTHEQYVKERGERRKANKGCGVCPNCGNWSPLILNPDLRLHWFHWEKKDLYRCPSCGTEWESEWYRIEKEK